MDRSEGRESRLRLIKDILDEADIRWGIAAGAAIFVYARNRPPTDIDILVRPGDLEMVATLLGTSTKRESPSWGEVQKIDLGDVEIAGQLVIVDGLKSYRYWMDDEMVERSRPAQLYGIDVPVLSPEDLIALKAVLQRGPEQGKHDLEDIEALAEAVEIDQAYLRRRLHLMGAENRAAPVLKRWGWL